VSDRDAFRAIRGTDQIIICEPRKDCADPHPHRWHCMRGFAEAGDGTPGVAGVCPLKVCEQRGANCG
jgi:hypothetical protein